MKDTSFGRELSGKVWMVLNSVDKQNQMATASAPKTEDTNCYPGTIVKTESNFQDNLCPILVNLMK
jgi:hypothetical protein